VGTSPSIAPNGPEQTTWLVLDDFGAIGRSWRETDEDAADRETIIRDLFAGDYYSPVRIVDLHTAEGWSRDVTAEIASEVRQRVADLGENGRISASVLAFLIATNRD